MTTQNSESGTAPAVDPQRMVSGTELEPVVATERAGSGRSGRSLSVESRKKLSVSCKIAYASPETRAALSAKLKAKYASGTRKPNPEGTREKAAATLREGYASGRLKRPAYTPQLRAQIGKSVSKALTGRVTRKTAPAQWERDQLKARLKSDPRLAKGEANSHCRVWRLRSPMNVVYTFRNLRKFIEENSSLFAPDDIIWKPHGTGIRCRASAGIEGMSPRKKRPSGGWKGWTWNSQVERFKNEGRDLLERPSLGGGGAERQGRKTCPAEKQPNDQAHGQNPLQPRSRPEL